MITNQLTLIVSAVASEIFSIYRFGGNPLRTCVFGNVEHLLLANGAKGLFQSAIISPVSTSSIFAPVLQKHAEKGPKDLLHLVAKEIGCPFKASLSKHHVK